MIDGGIPNAFGPRGERVQEEQVTRVEIIDCQPRKVRSSTRSSFGSRRHLVYSLHCGDSDAYHIGAMSHARHGPRFENMATRLGSQPNESSHLEFSLSDPCRLFFVRINFLPT